MQALLYGIYLQWKIDFRNREILVVYYIVPLVFFLFMGNIFTTINPEAYQTLVASMIIFGVTMGAYLGTPTPLVQLYASEMKKSYIVGGIPLYTPAINNFISATIHLFIMSLCILFLGPLLFDGVVPEHMGLFLGALFLFVITCVAIGTLLGLVVKSTTKLTMFSQVLFLPSIMLSGIMFPNELLPEAMQYIGYIFPATWGFKMMSESTFQWSSWLPIIIVFIVVVLVILVLLRRVKKN